ncbi:MAG: NAD(P)-binding domain-containing protein [Ilumatobacteraceae bacterium]
MMNFDHPTVEHIDTLIIGAGQAGLAMSRCLTERGVDHVVIERGQIAERWRSERWDSLRLLTPNWMTRLPGHRYTGPDPDGFMTAADVVDFFRSYADASSAPVRSGTTVVGVRSCADGTFIVDTISDHTGPSRTRAHNVVVASGWCDLPRIPHLAAGLAADVEQVVPSAYRNPGQLADGGVLVVGASATGVQIARELRSAGRDVVVAVGRHSRLPRTYRGMDIQWWLDRLGTNRATIDRYADPARARNEPSGQLIGTPTRESVELTALHALGVRLAGRLTSIDGHRAEFADDLAANTASADARLRRTLASIDAHIEATGLEREVDGAGALAVLPPVEPLRDVDLRRAGIRSVVWATGYRRSYPWLQVPVLDAAGEIVHQRGVTPVPGVYVLGQRFQYRRDSNFIDGVGADAEHLARHIGCRRGRRALLAAIRP